MATLTPLEPPTHAELRAFHDRQMPRKHPESWEQRPARVRQWCWNALLALGYGLIEITQWDLSQLERAYDDTRYELGKTDWRRVALRRWVEVRRAMPNRARHAWAFPTLDSHAQGDKIHAHATRDTHHLYATKMRKYGCDTRAAAIQKARRENPRDWEW